MKITKNDWCWLGGQILMWIILLLSPCFMDFMSNFDFKRVIHAFLINTRFIMPLAIYYMANFYLFVPYLLLRKRPWLFALINLAVISGKNTIIFYGIKDLPMIDGYIYMVWFGVTFIYMLILGLAVGMRYIMQSNELLVRLEEEKKKNVETELVWLKNQLNPHFLFNTLNNISSLVRVNADVAQDSIGQLSDLMRYTLYESNRPLVPVDGEIEFMENYIDLMKLRCNELATIETDFRSPCKPMQVVPLLFISLIENAFKHGVNSRIPSFVRIKLMNEGDDLVFTCENSCHPKSNVDRSGSGIGLENLKRRLELTYPDRYVYAQEKRDNTYYVQIILKNCV